MKEPTDKDLELLRALEAEASLAAEFYTNEVASQQIEAFKRYYGEPYGDEVEGRSQVVSRETFETVEWTRGDLRRVFGSGGRIVELDAQSEEEDEYAEDAADFLQHQFFRKNKGRKLLSSFTFDGLLQKRGYMAGFWVDAEYDSPEPIEGLNLIQFEELMADESIELEGEPEVQYAERPEDVRVTVQVKKLKRPAYIKVLCIAPEDMRVNARYDEIDDMPCVGHDERVTVSDLIREFPAHEADIRELASSNRSDASDYDERRHARFRNEEEDPDLAVGSSDLMQEVIVKRDYIWFDYDGDGYAEMRQVRRLGDLILENEEVEENPYASWTPNHVPHKWFGLSAHDEVADLERAQTVIRRGALDAHYQAVAPRAVVNQNTINLADALTVRPGSLIRNDGPATEGMMPIVIPDLSQAALLMGEYFDKLCERRTGVQRRAQALDPDALHDTAQGERLLQNAASVRKEDKASNLAEGLEALFGKMYRLCCRHMEKPQSVRLSKKRQITVDPTKWRKDMELSVHVGLGTGAKEEQLAMLQVVQADQLAWVANFGFAKEGEGGVTPRQAWNLFEEKLRVMGFTTADQFCSQPAPGWMPPPQPSPEMAKVEAQKQADTAKLQLQAQTSQVEQQLDMQKAQAEQALEVEKMKIEFELKRQQMLMEMQLKREQITAELQLKREVAMRDLDIKQQLADKGIPSTGGKPNGGGNGSTVNVGGNPG